MLLMSKTVPEKPLLSVWNGATDAWYEKGHQSQPCVRALLKCATYRGTSGGTIRQRYPFNP